MHFLGAIPYEDYLRLLDRSEFKLEYCDGVIYAMADRPTPPSALPPFACWGTR